MTTLNPFLSSDAFSLTSLTDAINIMPNMYGRIAQLNLMPFRPVTTRSIMVEEQAGVLNLIQSRPVGSPGWNNKMGKRTVRTFTIPHFPLDDQILPAEYDGIRAFGSENAAMGYTQVMNNHLQTIKNKHDITLEYLRMGALKGVIVDADTAEIYDLYTEFGISQESQSFAFASSDTEIREKCLDVIRHIEDNLKGEVYTGVRALCGETFFNSLISHDHVKEVYLNHAAAINAMGGDVRKGFNFGGITFEEYRGTATDKDGNARAFLTATEAIAFPEGTQETFCTYVAPGDFAGTVNTMGTPYYAKLEPRKFDRGVDIHTQSNVLPMCKRPGVLVTLTSS